MAVYTNMTWPDDPYRTGQQLYRRPGPRLAAFTAGPRAGDGRAGAASAAMVYLPLHRTRVMAVSETTLTFGFRAVCAAAAEPGPACPDVAGSGSDATAVAGADDAPADDSRDGDAAAEIEAARAGARAGARSLAATADLDLMQARRHAAVLAGHFLPGDLAMLRSPGGVVLRGVTAVQLDWPGRRQQARDRAAMFDCLLDLPGGPSLEHACQQGGIALGPGLTAVPDEPDGCGLRTDGDLLAARAVQRALAIALVCARRLGRYQWQGTLHTETVMAASAWDCFPSLGPCAPGPETQQPPDDDRSFAQAGRVPARP
jgi:hypothetical protein